MADEKKPRKLKDLRARLGKTIGPQGAGSAIAGGKAVPPPGPSVARGAPVPPALGGNRGVPAPVVAGTPFAPQAPTKEASADPFAAAEPTEGPRDVRIVVDDSAVKDADVGRGKRTVVFVVLAVGIVVGLGVSIAFNIVNSASLNWNQGVRTAKALYQGVQATSESLAEVQVQLDTLKEAAKGGPGKEPAVDYDAVGALLAVPNPARENPFSLSQDYRLLAPGTVGGVQAYYQQIATLWQKFSALKVRTGENRREALDASAKASLNVARPVGCVPTVVDNRFVCSLGFLFVQEDGSVKIGARPRTPESRQEAKQVFTGEGNGLATAPSDHVIIVHNETSLGVLGQQASEFAEYQQLLLEMEQLVEKAIELQTQIESQLGRVSALEERFALFDSSAGSGH